MKVFLSTDTVGGVWDHTVTLARELHRAGCEVLIGVLGEPRDERLVALPVGVEVVWRAYRLEWMPDAAADVHAAGEWLERIAGLWGADVVHLNQLAYAVRPFAAPTLVAAHSDVLSWWSETRGEPAPAEWTAYQGWVRDGLAAADVVVAPTAYQSALLERHFGRGADPVIHNGVAPPGTPSAPREEFLAVAAGRAWDLAKGFRTLDDAVGLLGGDAPAAHLLGEFIAPHGQGWVPANLEVHGRVERNEVDAWMAQASVYVAPSLYEPFGLAPLEAAFHGCALVLADIGSFRELWNGCARFFPPGDAAALADVLRELRANPERCSRLAAAARTRAERRYTAERMAAAYLRLYREMRASYEAAQLVSQSSAAPR